MHIGALISIASSVYAAISASKPAESTAATAAAPARTTPEQPSTIVSLSGQKDPDGPYSQFGPHEYANDIYGQMYSSLGNSRSRAASQTTPNATTSATSTAATAGSAITIAPSGNGINGIDQTSPLLPNQENIAGLMEKTTAQLGYRLDQAGIPRSPGFTLEIADPNTGRISVKGEHPNKDAIEQLANGDPALRQTLQTANALSSHYAGMERSAAYQQEAQSAQNAQQAAAVNAKYADLLAGNAPPAKVSFNYDGRQAAVSIR